uniref:Putative secreted protein midgut overexpressed n=1 Tax=Rhipicephalus microplus TaxID=6941 RepID=A0A6M2DB52_RHIMP
MFCFFFFFFWNCACNLLGKYAGDYRWSMRNIFTTKCEKNSFFKFSLNIHNVCYSQRRSITFFFSLKEVRFHKVRLLY